MANGIRNMHRCITMSLQAVRARVLVATVAAAALAALSGSAMAQEPLTDDVVIEADLLTYDETRQSVEAEGNVTVAWKDRVLKAEQVRYLADRELLYAEGDIALKEGDDIVYGASATYDLRTSTGVISRMAGYSSPWFFAAETAEKKPENTYTARGLALTNCELDHPHWFIRAKKARIRLNRRITVYNAVVYVRNIPVFYLPVYVSGMGSTKHQFDVQPGYNETDGLLLYMTLGYPLTEDTYGKLYVDYLGRRGIGKGAEYSYNIAEALKGSIYGYHIRENTTGRERGTLRAQHWQRLNAYWTARGVLDYQSDTAFNTFYEQDNWNRAVQRLHSYASFTRQDAYGNFTAITERFDRYRYDTGSFEPERIVVPRLSYTGYKRKGGLPFYTSYSGFLQNVYTEIDDYYLVSGGVNGSVTNDYKLSRRLTLTPVIGLSETWRDRRNSLDTDDVFVTRYFSRLNLRQRVAYWIDWDWRYFVTLRSGENTLGIDTDATDYGFETNRFSFINSMYLARGLTMRNSVGYDLRRLRGDTAAWYERFEPLVNEITWTPGGHYSLFVREESNVYPHYLRSFSLMSNIGDPEKRYVNFGMFYNTILPSEVDFNVGFGFWPTRSVKVDYSLLVAALDDFGDYRVNSQDIKLYFDLHCWELSLGYRVRGTIDNVAYIQLNLKTPARIKQDLYEKIYEREFYPWREER